MHTSRNEGGFTLLEVMTVVAIIGVLTAMSLIVLNMINQRDAIAQSVPRFIEEVQTGRNYALETANDVAYVIAGPTDSKATGAGGCYIGTRNPVNCVQYWLLEIVPGFTFDATAMSAFDGKFSADPTTGRAWVANSYYLIETDYMPVNLYIGVHDPAFPPAAPLKGIFAGVPPVATKTAYKYCGFCSTAKCGAIKSAACGVITLRADGTVSMPMADQATDTGELIYFNAGTAASVVADTRIGAILQPSGIMTDRIGQLIR